MTISAGTTFSSFSATTGATGTAELINDGVLELGAGSFLIAAAVVNNGSILVNGSATEIGAPLTNNGTLTLTGGGTATGIEVGDALTNTGLLQITDDATLELSALINSNNGGTISLDSSSSIIDPDVLAGGVLNTSGGTLNGQGTLQDVAVMGDAVVNFLNVAGTTSFAGATPGTAGSYDVVFGLTFANTASLGDVAVTLEGGEGHGLTGAAALTLGGSSSVTFVKGLFYESIYGTVIKAATSLTLSGTVASFADGYLTLAAADGDILNTGTIQTAAGETLAIAAPAGTFTNAGSLQIAAGTTLLLGLNVSAASFNTLSVPGTDVVLSGTLGGGGGVATVAAGSTFSSSGGALSDVTIDAEGTIGTLFATFDALTWVGQPLEIENTGITYLSGGLAVLDTADGAGTLVIGGTNSILDILDSETLDHMTLELGDGLSTGGNDTFSELDGANPSLDTDANLTFGTVTLSFVGNNENSGIADFDTITVLGTVQIGAPAITPNAITNANVDTNGLEQIRSSELRFDTADARIKISDQQINAIKNSTTGDPNAQKINATGMQQQQEYKTRTELAVNLANFGAQLSGQAHALAVSASAPPSGVTTTTLAALETTIEGAGTIVIADGGGFYAEAAIAPTVVVNFDPTGGFLDLFVPADMAGQITGFGAGDGIDLTLDGYTGGTATYSDGQLVVATASGDVSLNLQFASGSSATDVQLADDTQGGTLAYIVACFAEGTRIATPRGEVAVEALRVGDLVLAKFGGAVPVRWLGHRRIDCRYHPRPGDVWPVRVRADAFGRGAPRVDLLLSPDHAVYHDGALIPVRYLVNGATVVQEVRDVVTYWHVELDRHDVLLAENLPCESFLDTGNRAAFTAPSDRGRRPYSAASPARARPAAAGRL